MVLAIKIKAILIMMMKMGVRMSKALGIRSLTKKEKKKKLKNTHKKTF